MKKALPFILLILVIASMTGNVLLYSKWKSANAENQNLNNTVSEIQASMDNLENQLSEVQADLSDTNTKNEGLQSENESLQSEIESLQAELEKLHSTGLDEASANNNNDSQSGRDVASEDQETAQSNQVSQEQEDSQSNQSSNTDVERIQETVRNLFGEGATGGPTDTDTAWWQ
jgi:chromosome segregation ATPase